MCDSIVLERDGFGTHPCFEAFVAYTSDTKEIVGLATYFYTYSTWEGKSLYMDDIYVQKQHRRKGVGFFLFRAVAQVNLLSKFKNNLPQINYFFQLRRHWKETVPGSIFQS